MKRKVLPVFVCISMLLALFTGCGGAQSSSQAEPATGSSASEPAADSAQTTAGRKFGYTSIDSTNPLFISVEDAIRETLDPGDTLLVSSPRVDVALQIDQIEDLITQGIAGMFLCPVDAEGILPALDQLKDAEVPIVNFDSEVADMSYVISFVGSDNYNAGKVCGEDLVKKRPDGGPILVLDMPSVQSMVDRTNGFLDAIEGHGFEVVGQLDSKGDLEVAMRNAEDLLQAHPDVIAIFGGNDPTAIGAQAAAKAAGITECLIYGVDGSPDMKAEIADPDSLIEGCGAQSPKNMGRIAAEVMLAYLAGEQVEARYPVETILITADNVDEYGIDGWQ